MAAKKKIRASAAKKKIRASAADLFYLPDDCWLRIFKLLLDGDDADCDRYLKPLSTVSKEFLSFTNRHKFSLTISSATRPFLPHFFQRFPNLTSLNLSHYYTADLPTDFNAILLEISRFPMNLRALDLSYKPIIPKDGLRALSQKITTLTCLTCSHISSIHNTDMLLIAECFPLLEELDLSYPGKGYNNDCTVGVEALSRELFKLRKVNLSRHRYINNRLLFHLFKNCKLLEEAIILDCHQLTNAGIATALHERPTLRSLSFANSKSLVDFGVSPQLESLHLVHSWWKSNDTIKRVPWLFPNLQRLDLSRRRVNSGNEFVFDGTEEGICNLLRNCSKIKHLNLTHYPIVMVPKMNFKVPKLEVLNLSYTEVDDEALRMISKSCCRLLHLLLEGCFIVTMTGLKHVVENCTQLREINLRKCLDVHADAVALIVSSRPSLRKIIAPPRYSFSDNEWEFLGSCLIIA
ncbi:putative leucine-rich repeat domain, L domain-containing protein [Medicago truncatula]|uniref:F-box/RNI superfamily protein n=1 Tax=Medicago truncatula TaxID=3880 RepID=A0A072UIY8_MEDTR|nr:F-box/LRR-repeat protein 16 [Medicago truncatula]KEH29068.1 F-box/RNI superfamily protein [Medicago truncatula]RHN59134.1 putative leucine-rich repeat domain, L domain-containing protein [Medicago truncatula]